MQFRTAVFDLDGTLADTAADLIDTTNDLLKPYNLPPLGLAETRNLVGMGGRQLVRRAFEAAGRPVTDAEVEDLYPQFIEIYLGRLSRSSRLYDGVADVLDRLRAVGWILGVCTNKPIAPATELLGRLGIAGHFQCILGGDSLPVRKPDPAHLLGTVRGAGGVRERAVMVGDSENDLAAARAAGIPCVLMTYGYSPQPVERLRPDRLADRFEDLPDLFAELVQ